MPQLVLKSPACHKAKQVFHAGAVLTRREQSGIEIGYGHFSREPVLGRDEALHQCDLELTLWLPWSWWAWPSCLWS